LCHGGIYHKHADKVSDILVQYFDLQPGDFTVHLHHLEDFLIIFTSRATKGHFSGDHFINQPHFTLSLRPWCKLAHVEAGRFMYCVKLELHGIPTQAWHLSTAEHILGGSCWIERLHLATRSCSDLVILRLSAGAHDPAAIRRRASLEIVEIMPSNNNVPPIVTTLVYLISI
jgi:hypothetical protein